MGFNHEKKGVNNKVHWIGVVSPAAEESANSINVNKVMGDRKGHREEMVQVQSLT